ncbi:hypothetical protein [Psychrobacter sp. 1044]|uniref:hypothetical protein n=1 Tax=Psychrobacter sp. 1044 TaxID=2772562 RepID=UPI00191A68EA|nr:hypothetical protein [Psychrobacter sp. 1044]
MTNGISSEQAFEHAWKYFELHSSQRTILFNYFLFIIAGLGAGIGATLQASNDLLYIGTFLSIFVVLVSIVFWKLDQRTSFLVKQSESILKKLESNSDSTIGIFINENANLIRENNNRNYFSKILTYGAVFRFTFGVTSSVGIGLVLLFVTKILGCLT